MHKSYTAFTLAEVLITLAIIGVVAAITIPSINNNIKDQQYKTAYKNAFAIANQAWQQCVTENEIEYRSGWNDTANARNFLKFKEKFKVIVDCTDGNTSKCWTSGDNFYSILPVDGSPSFIDNSGIAWSTERPITQNGGGCILLDTNGNKLPNQYGKDRFAIRTLLLNTDNSSAAGTPTRIGTWLGDYANPDPQTCPFGGCYYKSWLID